MEVIKSKNDKIVAAQGHEKRSVFRPKKVEQAKDDSMEENHIAP